MLKKGYASSGLWPEHERRRSKRGGYSLRRSKEGALVIERMMESAIIFRSFHRFFCDRLLFLFIYIPPFIL